MKHHPRSSVLSHRVSREILKSVRLVFKACIDKLLLQQPNSQWLTKQTFFFSLTFYEGRRLTVGQPWLWQVGSSGFSSAPCVISFQEPQWKKQTLSKACCSHGGGQAEVHRIKPQNLKLLFPCGRYQVHSHSIDQRKSNWSSPRSIRAGEYLSGLYIEVWQGREGMNNCEQIIQYSFNEFLDVSELYLVHMWNRNKNRLLLKNKWDICKCIYCNNWIIIRDQLLCFCLLPKVASSLWPYSIGGWRGYEDVLESWVARNSRNLDSVLPLNPE